MDIDKVPFFNIPDMIKLAAVNSNFNKSVDSNRSRNIETSVPYYHLAPIIEAHIKMILKSKLDTHFLIGWL